MALGIVNYNRVNVLLQRGKKNSSLVMTPLGLNVGSSITAATIVILTNPYLPHISQSR